MSWGKNVLFIAFLIYFLPFWSISRPIWSLFTLFDAQTPFLVLVGEISPHFLSPVSQQGSQDSTICASLARDFHPNGSRVVTMSLTLFLPQDSWFTAFIVLIEITNFMFFITMELYINEIWVAKMRLARRTTTISLTSSWWSSWQRWCWLDCEGTTAACCADLLWRLNRLQIWSDPL